MHLRKAQGTGAEKGLAQESWIFCRCCYCYVNRSQFSGVIRYIRQQSGQRELLISNSKKADSNAEETTEGFPRTGSHTHHYIVMFDAILNEYCYSKSEIRMQMNLQSREVHLDMVLTLQRVPLSLLRTPDADGAGDGDCGTLVLTLLLISPLIMS